MADQIIILSEMWNLPKFIGIVEEPFLMLMNYSSTITVLSYDVRIPIALIVKG
jgi:hypothetical protein